MIKQALIASIVSAAVLLPVGVSTAAGNDHIYGSQLMTNQERLEYRKKTSNAKSTAEREMIQNEHHAMIKKRAKQRNITLPDDAPASSGSESEQEYKY